MIGAAVISEFMIRSYVTNGPRYRERPYAGHLNPCRSRSTPAIGFHNNDWQTPAETTRNRSQTGSAPGRSSHRIFETGHGGSTDRASSAPIHCYQSYPRKHWDTPMPAATVPGDNLR